ncbi:hypothetical protein [Halobacterium litoreum]|uniref:CARDB domain-containing protein n=1 Tax=Halobacterium litoreum TaxID=2039234 RepID=A0ABD5NCU4_9EURY|nr:hypothetical protein [Halobacterium litoreum]UHH14039.1 hypothetical protein LT972_03335 [Halobacterium litoreum]
MASVSSAHLVLFIAAVLVAAAVAGTFTSSASRLGNAIAEDSSVEAEQVDAEIRVVSDPSNAETIYDPTTETLTVVVKNTGDEVLSAAPEDVVVLVNGTYQSDVRTTVLTGDDWRPGDLLRVRANVSLPEQSETRVVVAPTGSRDLLEFTTPDFAPDRSELVFVNASSGALRTIDAGGSITQYGVNATAIGPKQVDFDDDERLEIPFVTDAGALRLVDATGEETTLVASGVETNRTLLAVGAWRGETSVYYVNESDGDTLYRVRPGASPTQILVGGSSQSAGAVAGVADVNGDGDTDLVFANATQDLFFVDGDSAARITTVGLAEGVGVGQPREFDSAPPSRVPVMDDTGNVSLYDATGVETQLTTDGANDTGPVAGFDWTDDGNPDPQVTLVEDGVIKYVEADGTIETRADVNASAEVGVA